VDIQLLKLIVEDMGVRDLSQPIVGKFKNVNFMFFNFVNNQKESLIIDSFEDLIVGRPAMCRNDLWNKLFNNICCDCTGSTCSPPIKSSKESIIKISFKFKDYF
jgi:hypothetical protein